MRSILVLALLATAVHARPAPSPILPPVGCYLQPAVYPVPGSTSVQLDAKAWIVASELAQFDIVEYRLRSGKSSRVVAKTKHAPFDIIELDLGKLLPKQKYELLEGDHVISTFVTGVERDPSVPAAPVVLSAVAMNDMLETSYLELELARDPERVLVELRIGAHTMVAPFDQTPRLGASCANIAIVDKFCFEVRAIDVAGKRSAPTSHCATVNQGPGLEPYTDNREGYRPAPEPKDNTGWRVVLGLVLLFVTGLWLIVRARRRSPKHLA